MTLTYESFSIPDRFVVVFDGATVIDTGYIGLAKFQSRLNTAVAAKGDVAGAIDPITSGSVSFIKDSAFEYATVYVYAPLNNTSFEFTLSCPEDYTTTTEAPTTTSEEPTTTSFECVLSASLNQVDCEDWDEGCVGCYKYLLENISATENAEFHVITCSGVSTTIEIIPDSQLILCLAACMVYPMDDNGVATRVEDCTPVSTTTEEPTTTSEQPTTTAEPTTTEEVTTTEEITTTPELTTTVEPTTTSNELTTTAEPTTTVEPTTTSEELTTTEEPTTTVEPTTVEPTTTLEPTTTEEPTTTIPPETDYGYLYNWWAAIGDTDGDNVADTSIANTGWHIPSYDEYKTLADYLGAGGDYSTNTVGGKLKETGTTYWNSPNTGATNDTNFNGRASGERNSTGAMAGRGQIYRLWTSYPYGGNPASNSAVVMTLWYNSEKFSSGSNFKTLAQSLRLIKDTTTLSHGETGTYKGNNGITYPTICIGTQEWLAANLEETKFRDGTNIPYIDNEDSGDDALWAAATSAAYCIYPIT